MKHTKTVIVPAVPERISTVPAFTTCDLCKKEIISDKNDLEEVKVQYKSGWESRECGQGTQLGVDMCGECFTTKLVPWLRTQGAEPREEEWSWDF